MSDSDAFVMLIAVCGNMSFMHTSVVSVYVRLHCICGQAALQCCVAHQEGVLLRSQTLFDSQLFVRCFFLIFVLFMSSSHRDACCVIEYILCVCSACIIEPWTVDLQTTTESQGHKLDACPCTLPFKVDGCLQNCSAFHFARQLLLFCATLWSKA